MGEHSKQTQSKSGVERRIHHRVQVPLPARFITQDGQEVECLTSDVSAGGIRFRTVRPPALGAKIVAYVQDLGRVEGVTVRHLPDGFAIAFLTTALKAQRVAEKVALFSGASERRMFQRLELDGARIALRLANDEERSVDIIDVSTRGLAFRCEEEFEIGDRMEIGAQDAVVVRLFDGGAAVSFL